MSIASSNHPEELKVLENFSARIHQMSKEETLTWLWNAIDDLEMQDEACIYATNSYTEKAYESIGFTLMDIQILLSVENQYALIYVLIHRLLFCNRELESHSA